MKTFFPTTEVIDSRNHTSFKQPVIFLGVALLIFSAAFSQQDSSQLVSSFSYLKISAFEARAVSRNVQLLWGVSGNEEAKTFEIERTAEGGIYQKVGSKLSSGKKGEISYEFVDALPRKNTALYYRIKVIGKDGSVSFSPAQNVRITDNLLQCRLKQNPVRNSVDVEIIAAEASLLHATIFTAYGQRLLSETATLSAGTHPFTLSATSLSPGLHRLVLEAGNERKVISFIKE
jgi:hypothetical protein